MKLFIVCCGIILKALLVTAVVETPLGPIEGTTKKSFNGRPVSAFEGIPYAKPPVGELRFKEPEPVEPWSEVLKATKKVQCLQTNLFSASGVVGQEDCLYLNVYVPREVTNPDDNLDVIVHVHGGAFQWASGHIYAHPQYFMDHDVILVTLNYRLGIFGFLSTNDDVVPGNNGLKDQVAALKWVQQNIKSFGGNPDSVTLTGLSAGAASVHHHYLSPLSKGLFHRGFSQSGTTLNPWALQKEPLQKAQTVAAAVGCTIESTKDMVECLREVPAEKIVPTIGLFYAIKFIPVVPFGPVVENGGENPFLSDHPAKLLSEGKINDVPWIVSNSAHEGLFPGIFLRGDLDMVNEKWSTIGRHVMDFNFTIPLDTSEMTLQKIKERYFGNEDISEKTFLQFIQMLSERHFFSGSSKAAKLHSKASKSDIYYYLFSYPLESNQHKTVGHGDDAIYFFYHYLPMKISENDLKLKDLLFEMLISFAKTGKPEIQGVTWDPLNHSGGELTFININGYDREQIKQTTVPEFGNEQFWHDLKLLDNEIDISKQN